MLHKGLELKLEASVERVMWFCNGDNNQVLGLLIMIELSPISPEGHVYLPSAHHRIIRNL